MAKEHILKFLADHLGSRIALVGHLRPDGDAFGSCIGLASILRTAGYRPKVVNPSPLPPHLSFLVDESLILHNPDVNWWRDFDCLGVLDCGETGRLEEINREAAAHLPTFTIDHHVTSAGIGEASWIEAEASSTGELVVRLCQAAKWTLPEQAAMALWTAIVSDTSRFSYENTSADALAAARECVLAGADPTLAARAMFQSVSVAERKLQTRVLERMELHEGGRLGLSWIRWEDFEAAGTTVEGAPDLINLIRDTSGVEVAIFLYEPPTTPTGKQMVKISLRAQPPHDALAIALRFNGGGHNRAAGASAEAGIPKVREQVLELARQSFFSGDASS